MKILTDYDLTNLNTLGVSVRAKFFTEVSSEEDLTQLFAAQEFRENPKVFLGGGSNVLFTQDWGGIVILNKIEGIEMLEENEVEVVIRAMSGEVWHDLVLFAVERNLWGIENLAFIPGSVGAAPMQNIGAYGAEIKNVLEEVEAYDVETGRKKIFSMEECELGYRESVFKNKLRGKYFILAIKIKLSKIPNPKITYRHLKEHLIENKVEVRTSEDISQAVTHIRKTKLPDPKVIKNAGSFFKNVFLAEGEMAELLKNYPTLPYFEEGGVKKVPAGWLIEQAGWKGKKVGKVGVHEKHALVLVNHGGGTGQEIKELADKIIASVYAKFGITLVPEVNLIR